MYWLIAMALQKKKLYFTFITLLLFFAIIALIETALRIAFPSLNTPFVHELIADNTEWYEINRHYLKKYFTADSPLIPELKPARFQKIKRANTFRIVCLGSSSMLGTPYQLNASIPGIVRRQLRHLYPAKEIEVINLGAAAINSNVIVELAKNILPYKPDLVLIYMGHNEFYGPDGVGASWLQKKFPFLTRVKYFINDLLLIKAIENLLTHSGATNKSRKGNLMQQVSNQQKVYLHSEESETTFKTFEANTIEIVSLFKQKNIPVIISDISSNLLFPPFLYDSIPQNIQRQFKALAARAEQAGNTPEAIESAVQSISADTVNALLHYLRGTIYMKLKHYSTARTYLLRAKDEDLLKFRAPSTINAIIASIASSRQIPFISADSLFSSLSEFGIQGNNLFLEHLHPNAKGYYEIATLFVKKIVDLKLLSPDNITYSQLLPFNYDSLSIPWLDIAYGDIAMQHLTSQAPFQHYPAQPLTIQDADSVLLAIARNVYFQRISLTEGCYKTAERFIQLHKYKDALTTYAYLSEEYPANFYPYYL